jgi:hypothetical protein
MQPAVPISQVGALDSIPDHTGKPRIGGEFFADPPPEIGQIISADSNLGRGLNPTVVLFLAALIAIGIILIFQSIAASPGVDRNSASSFRIIGYVLGAIVLVLGILKPGIRTVCTYIGPDGIARFSMKGRGGVPKSEMLPFEQAAELQSSQTRRYIHGAYVGTNYLYTWTDPDGRRLFRCKGSHRARKNKLPKPHDAWHFANSAELAWSRHYLARAQQWLETEGSIPFRLDKKRWLRVGPGFMEFHFGGEPVRVTKEEIATVSLASGQFSFKNKDAKWYSRDGKYSFRYGTMANARVFLMALDKLMGWRWQ